MKKLLLTIAVLFSSIWVLGTDSKLQFPDTYNFRRGAEAMDAGQVETALEFFNKDIQENPKNAVTYICIAMVRAEKKEYGKALNAYNAGLRVIPKKDKVLRTYVLAERADVYLQLKDTVKALNDLSAAIKLTGSYASYDTRAQLYYELKEYSLSDADYRTMLKLKEGDAISYDGLGRNLASQGKAAEALELFDRAIILDPSYMPSYRYKALTLMLLDRYDEVIDCLAHLLYSDDEAGTALDLACKLKEPYRQKFISKLTVEQLKNSNNPIWLYYLGYMYQHSNEYEKAINTFEKLNQTDPSSVVYCNIAKCYNALGMYENGLEAVNMALNMEPDSYSAKETKTHLLYDLGRLSEVVEIWDGIVTGYPTFAEGYSCRADAKRYLDMQGAIDDYSTAILLDDKNSYFYFSRGDLYKLKGDTMLANADYNKVIELENTPEKYFCIYFAYQGLGQNDKAIEILESIIAKDTLDAGSYYNAACLYARMGNKERAISYLRESFEKGLTYSYHVECDFDLQSIRDTDEYKSLVEEYRVKQRKSDVLKQQESSDEGELSGNSSISEIPFTKEHGTCKVKCSINDLPLYFVFDTGASDVTMSLVEANFMLKNGYLSKKDVIGSQSYIDANGDVSVGTVLNLKKVTFGGHNLTNVKASVVRNQKAPLLLGQSVLGRLGRIEIDNKNSVIRIKN